MRLRQLELSAFRGFKEPTTIPFGPGFTVITGRNGSGKSSICDALEFVLTQNLSRFGPADVEGGERIEDYIWWRNTARSAKRHVKAVFDLDDGTVGERTATPTGVENTFDESAFYHNRPQVSDPFSLLSQTMLIRDESITKFSTDLPEADRFDFFYKAIGLTDLLKIEERANTLVKQLGRVTEDLEKQYRQRREAVAQVISEISEARTAAARVTTNDAVALQQRLTVLTGMPPDTPLRQLAAGVTRTLADQKNRLDRLERLNVSLSQSHTWLEDLRRFEERRDTLKASLDTAEVALKDSGNARIAAGEALRQAQTRNVSLGARAQLRELGMRIGLQEGHCPLCGSSITSGEFDTHLKEIQELINSQSTTLADLTAQEASRTAEYEQRRNDYQSRSIEYSRALSDCETLKAALTQLQNEAQQLGVKLEAPSIESELLDTRKRVTELQSGLSQLEGSSAFDRIADLEKQREVAQSEVERITKQIDLISKAAQNAKSAADTTKRVSWESVDDCLAELSPLLSNYLCD